MRSMTNRSAATSATRSGAAILSLALVVPMLSFVAAVPAAAADYSPVPVMLSDFKDPGQWQTYVGGSATASFEIDPSMSVTGDSSGKLSVSIPDGTAEIVANVPVTDAAAVEFSVRTSDVDMFAVRLVDSTEQVHQQLIELDTSQTGWQTIRIEDFDSGLNYVSWGGAGDGVWHGPIIRVGFVLDMWSTADGQTDGTVSFDALQALMPVPALGMTPLVIGNAFDVGQPVRLGFVTLAERLSWTVRDATGTEVDSGAGLASALDGVISPGVTAPGWYEVDIVAIDADGTRHEGGTDFSITAPFDFSTSDDSRLAVSSHYGGLWPLDSAPLIAKAGFSASRDEAYWAATERVPGEFVWQEQVNAYQAELDSLGVNHVQILSYGNPLYFEDEAPTTPEGREAFARYALETVEKFGTDDTVFEVWNEWNWRDLDGAAGGSAFHYVELLKVLDEVVRPVYPDVTFIGPALAPMNDWQGWFQEFTDLGGLDLVDAVSTHPYTFPIAPEGSTRFEGHIATLKSIMSAAGHPDMPMYLSEVGWPTGTGSQAVSELVQARYLVRAQLLSFAGGIDQFTIYDFIADGLDPHELEDNFGIVRNWADPRGAYVPRPAFVSNAVLARQINELPVSHSEDLGAGVYDVVFDDASGARVHAAWALADTTLAFSASSAVTVTDLFGAVTELEPDAAGRVYVVVGEDPVYVSGVISDVTTTDLFAMRVDEEVAGEVTAGVVTLDNSEGSSSIDFTVTAGGSDSTATAPAEGIGEAAAAYPAQSSVGARTYVATVSIDGKRVGYLTARGTAASPLSLSGTHAISADGSDALRVSVQNTSSRAVAIDGVDWVAGDSSGVGLEGAEIPAKGSVFFDVPVTVDGPVSWTSTLRRAEVGSLTASGTLLPVTDAISAPAYSVAVDGEVDAPIESLPSQNFLAAGDPPVTGWGGASDLSGELWLTHDESNLYLTARVTDDVHVQPATGGDTWQGDGIQWGITAGAAGESDRVHEFGAALTSAGTVDVYRWAPTDLSSTPEGMRATVTRDDATDITLYELAIPWTTLGIDPGTRLVSTTVVVNENDGAGRGGWMTWGQGVAESKNADLFRTVVLETAAEVDKSALQQAITDFGALDAADYSLDSWASIVSAHDSAVAVNEDAAATVTQVEDATAQLVAAREALALAVTGISVSTSREVYGVGESFDLESLTVAATLSDGSTVALTPDDYSIDGFASDVAADLTLTVTVNGGRAATGADPISAVISISVYAAWNAHVAYGGGERVFHDGSVWLSTWWTQNQAPGDPHGSWQQLASEGGVTVWTPSRIFVAGDVVMHNGVTYVAKWWTRNQAPGDQWGPWAVNG